MGGEEVEGLFGYRIQNHGRSDGSSSLWGPATLPKGSNAQRSSEGHLHFLRSGLACTLEGQIQPRLGSILCPRPKNRTIIGPGKGGIQDPQAL